MDHVITEFQNAMKVASTDFNDLRQRDGLDSVREQHSLTTKIDVDKRSVPTNFSVNAEGVYFHPPEETNGNLSSPLKICSPLEITARTRDEEGLNHGRLLEFSDPDGKHHQWAMPMEMLAGDGTEYRRILLSRGLEIAPSRKAREQLTNYIQSTHPQKVTLCVERTGWYKNIFILPNESIGDFNEKILLQTPLSSPEGFSTSGAILEWQENISKLCIGNSRLLFAISAAFAAAGLHLLQEESGGFHFVGSSSIGKTTLLQLACSVWGGQDRLHRWRATSNGLEAIATLHNDSLLCLDEMGQVDAKEVGEIAYMLANGSGKGRCLKDGSARKKSSWRLLFLSTGEMGLADHIHQGGKKAKAGQAVRLVDIPAEAGCGLGVFENLHHFASADEFARYIGQSSKNYFGVPIRHFLHAVTRDIEKVKKFLDQQRCEFIKNFIPSQADGQVQRVGLRFALLAAAGELATHFNITGWEKEYATMAAHECFNDWVKLRGGLGSKEASIALTQVRHFFEAHGESRFTRWNNPGEQFKTLHRAGFRCGGEFFVFPESFKQDICMGLNPQTVAELCIAKGWLLPDGEGKATTSHRMPDTSKTRRVYHFSDNVLGDDV
jgi:putative DNA primase/helicase